MKQTDSTDIPKARQFNRAQLAEFFSVALTTIDTWVRLYGCPVVRRGSRGVPAVYDILAVAEWRYTREDQQAHAGDDPEAMSPKDRKDWWAGEESRLRIEALRAKLMPTEVLALLTHSMLAAVRATLLAHHNTIAKALPNLPANVLADIERLNRQTAALLTYDRFPETIQAIIKENFPNE